MVVYEGEYFPGLVLNITTLEVVVKVMTMFGPNWKWPEQEDKLWYPRDDVVEKIKEPQLLNARGIYAIEELKKYGKKHN